MINVLKEFVKKKIVKCADFKEIFFAGPQQQENCNFGHSIRLQEEEPRSQSQERKAFHHLPTQHWSSCQVRDSQQPSEKVQKGSK